MFICAACGKVTRGKRRHAITCGAACRVRLHRHPELREHLASDSRLTGLSVADLLERRAFKAAYPDLAERIGANEINIEAARLEAFKRSLHDLYQRLKRRAPAA